MANHTLKVPARCPTDAIRRQSCGRCLRERLIGTPGIHDVKLTCADGGELATLELDYDPRLIPLHQLEHELSRADVCFNEQRGEVVLEIEGMISPRSEQVIESALAKLPGVTASASFASRSLRVEFDRRQCALPEIARRLDQLGFHLKLQSKAEAARPAG